MLVWVDTETTGLEYDALLLELAIVVTGDNLKPLANRSWVIHHHKDVVALRLNAWPRKQHGESGLLEEVEASKQMTPLVEKEAYNWLKEELGEAHCGKLPMCGSSVQFDRGKLEHGMPKLVELFHYRNVDVSSIKELAKRWHPELELPEKSEAHRAMADIMESIALLRFFKKTFFEG